MNIKYISFNVSKLAKEKGCNINSDLYYDNNGICRHIDYDTEDISCYRLSHSILDDWVSKNHNIFIEILIDKTLEPKYCFSVYKYDKENIEWINMMKLKYSDLYLDKYKCYEDALIYALNLIKTKN